MAEEFGGGGLFDQSFGDGFALFLGDGHGLQIHGAAGIGGLRLGGGENFWCVDSRASAGGDSSSGGGRVPGESTSPMLVKTVRNQGMRRRSPRARPTAT